MPDELKDSIEENARGPKSASGDSGSVEQHSLAEQIAADKYLEQVHPIPISIGFSYIVSNISYY